MLVNVMLLAGILGTVLAPKGAGAAARPPDWRQRCWRSGRVGLRPVAAAAAR